jgi:hypothetical protein
MSESLNRVFLEGLIRNTSRLVAVTLSRTSVEHGAAWVLQSFERHLHRELSQLNLGQDWVASQFGIGTRALRRRVATPSQPTSKEISLARVRDALSDLPAVVSPDMLVDTFWSPELRELSERQIADRRRQIVSLMEFLTRIGELKRTGIDLFERSITSQHYPDAQLELALWHIYRQPGISGERLAELMGVAWSDDLMAMLNGAKDKGWLVTYRSWCHLCVPAVDFRYGNNDWRVPVLDHYAAVCQMLELKVAPLPKADEAATDALPAEFHPFRPGSSTLRVDIRPERMDRLMALGRRLDKALFELRGEAMAIQDMPMEPETNSAQGVEEMVLEAGEETQLVFYIGRVEARKDAESLAPGTFNP